MGTVMSLRRTAIVLAVVAVGLAVVIAATGNMHAGRHDPAWVTAISLVCDLCVVALGGVGAVAAWRGRYAALLSPARLGVAFAVLIVMPMFAAQRGAADQWGGSAPIWADVLVVLSMLSLGGLIAVLGAARLRRRALR